MLKQMKKALGILLAVCFLVSVTAAAVSSEPVMVKEQSMDMRNMDMRKVDIQKTNMNIEIEDDEY